MGKLLFNQRYNYPQYIPLRLSCFFVSSSDFSSDKSVLEKGEGGFPFPSDTSNEKERGNAILPRSFSLDGLFMGPCPVRLRASLPWERPRWRR